MYNTNKNKHEKSLGLVLFIFILESVTLFCKFSQDKTNLNKYISTYLDNKYDLNMNDNI